MNAGKLFVELCISVFVRHTNPYFTVGLHINTKHACMHGCLCIYTGEQEARAAFLCAFRPAPAFQAEKQSDILRLIGYVYNMKSCVERETQQGVQLLFKIKPIRAVKTLKRAFKR